MFRFASLASAATAAHLAFALPGLGQQPDYPGDEAVLQALSDKAESGNADAQNALGTVYVAGAVVAPDGAEAIKWFKAAAAQGHAAAQANLGTMHLRGWGVEQDPVEAVRLFRLSADQDLPLGMGKLAEATMLGSGIEKNSAEGVRLLKMAAEMKDGYSAYRLSGIVGSGHNWPGLPQKDPAEAIRWMRISAESGYPSGQYEYARMHLPGHPYEVPGGFGEHLKWLRLGADGGDKDAQFDLAAYFRNGHGMPADAAEADKWFRRAAASGHMEAQRVLEGTGGWSPEDKVTAAAVLLGLGIGIAALAAADAETSGSQEPPPSNDGCGPGLARHPVNGQCYVTVDPRLGQALPTLPGY